MKIAYQEGYNALPKGASSSVAGVLIGIIMSPFAAQCLPQKAY